MKLPYSLKQSLRYIRRMPYQSVAAILILTLTFFLISIFILLSFGFNKVIHHFETRPQIIAFLKPDFEQEQFDQLKSQLEATGKTDQITYVDQQQAFEIYRQLNKNDPALLELVTPEILPASLEVSVHDPNDFSHLFDLMGKSPAVEEISFQQDVINNLTTWTKNIRWLGIGLISYLTFTSILIISIIISIKVSIRRQEISILQLLGATRAQISAPFMVEGLIYGAVSAFLAWVMTYTALLYATPTIVKFLGEIYLLPVPFAFMLVLLGSEVLLAGFVGAFASLLATRRFK
jgi:cell division transport system permease protein